MSEAQWVRAPRQARSLATLERFVAAVRSLLDERSFEDITVADIVTRAERTVGSFYARFEDKYAVLHVLGERFETRMRATVHAFCDPVRWDDATVADFIAESVRLNVASYRSQAPLFRALVTASATDPRFRARRLDSMRFCADEQKRFVLTRAAELDTADPARASDQMFELTAATLDHELLFGRFTATYPRSDAALVAELTSQCLSVLGAHVPPVAPHELQTIDR